MARYAGLIAGGVLLALGPFTGGATVKPGLLLLAMGAIAAITSKNPPSLDNARRAELQMATAASGVPVPVIFGEQRVTGNFMQFDKEQLRTVEIRQATPGGKGGGGGGGSSVVGYEYYLSYEYALCMGEVDGIAQVISTPGEVKLINEQPDVATTGAVATTASDFTRPALDATVVVTLASSELLDTGHKVQIVNKGNFTVTDKDVDNVRVTLRLDEKLGSQLGGFGSNTVPSGSSLTPINPTDTGATRKLVFDDTSEFTEGSAITIDGFSEWTVTAILSGTTADCEMTRLIGSGAIVVGTVVRTYVDPSVEFGTDETVELALSGAQEGGAVRVYRGTKWQTRTTSGDPYAANGMNYRPVCWALFMDYKVGTHPQAQSHHFILRRLPKCIRDDGTIFTGLKVRGSNDTTNPNYVQANPVAIIYEMLTNKTWGRGLSSSIFDEDSWALVSAFFATQNIGLGITLDQAAKLSDAIAGVRETARLVLLWDGDKLKIRTLLDTAALHNNILTVTKSEVSNVRFSRPSWRNTSNEVTAEFTDRARNYKSNSVTMKDPANLETVGVANPRRVSLVGVTETALAQRLAALILKENSYPLGALTFEANRSVSHAEPGDIIRFVWDEWSEGIITGYYQLGTIKRGGSESEKLEFQLTEDVDIAPVEAEETTITPPTVLQWNRVTGVGDDELRLVEPQQGNTLPISPIAVMEVPALLTGGTENRISIMGQKPIPGLTGIASYGAQFGGDLRFLGTMLTFCVTGTVLGAYAAGPRLDRRTGFEFSLSNPATDEGTVLEANSVVADSDHMSVLANSVRDYVVVGEEIMQVGRIYKVSTNRYRAINLLRGLFGTKVEAVPAGARIFFSRTMPDSLAVAALEQGIETRFRGYPVDTHGVANIGGDIYIAHAYPNDRLFLGLGVRPLGPEPYSYTPGDPDPLVGTYRVRPQFFDRGAAVLTFERACNTLITNIGAMRFMVEQLDGGGAVIQGKTLADHTFTSDVLDDLSKGMVTIEFTRQNTTEVVNIYTELNGEVSVVPAAFSV